jgi:GH25 family lysozyme M1 (1,4-beta-N-acetylmuramidase)
MKRESIGMSSREGRDEDREARNIAQYLERAHGLREPKALALAYRWQGYSHSGIARKIDSTEATVSKYMDEIEAEYGNDATLTPFPDEYEAVLEWEFDPLEAGE